MVYKVTSSYFVVVENAPLKVELLVDNLARSFHFLTSSMFRTVQCPTGNHSFKKKNICYFELFRRQNEKLKLFQRKNKILLVL